MKNLLIYINPTKKFSSEHEALTKIQIDHSLNLGWKPEDLLLVTNFDYSYRGISSIVVGDYEVFDANRSTKIPAINELFRRDIIDDEVVWFHDHDAFQLQAFEVNLTRPAGFTNQGWSKKWNAGSFFFTKAAKNIFIDIWHYMLERNTNEQDALTYMWENNINDINSQYLLMNSTYNIGIYYIDKVLKRAELPIKVAHFHPHKKRHLDLFREKLPNNLMSVFNTYGIV